MSASLVGSEMCIRDSFWEGRSLAPRRHPQPGGCAPAGTIGKGSPRPVPVSYTHLTLPTICSV
eukprot:1487633-Alexandrium_andersonii.AAC.1